MKPIRPLDPANYSRHLIHGEDRTWIETNCYVDVLIELIHSLGFEPIAGLPFTFCIDFEGDQWTFFKYPHIDLHKLYGLELQELNPWNKLVEHVERQVNLGRPVLVELDSYFLPDTAGTAYQIEHVKSTVAVNEISIEKKHMGYFHGQGYYHLKPEDFTQIFQLDGIAHERVLPPYIELVKCHRQPDELTGKALLSASLEVFSRNLALTPKTNPFVKFSQQFALDNAWLITEPIETFHKYSFATLRQYGACFELCETYLRWLAQQNEAGLDDCINAFNRISNQTKAFQFQLARAVARKRELSLEPLQLMAEDWQSSMDFLKHRYQ
jgi:hypothetical protein